ncbi:hypothetical protein [Serinicoccus kebangsaanensis]|uniref:hypothetical protein n=1 Tax=Serinicoccus kebangsaanensis TaxID=2602069 RepID=UPI00124D329B|nr:hypothetical protein [Serinicoccus kebangsaanensis]
MTEHPEPESRPTTGDDDVDATLRDLDEALRSDEPEAAADALAQAHRALQARLSDPSAPDRSGSAGAGPRPD